jgi:hypothetical protein
VTVNRRPDLTRQIEELRRRVKTLETQNRLSAGTIGGVRGGSVQVIDRSGNLIAYLGELLPAAPDGNPQPGLYFRRQDGTLAFAIFDPLPDIDGYNQFWSLWDRSANLIMSEDTTSGQGLARPYLPIPWVDVRSSTWPVTTSASMVDAQFTVYDKQHPYVEVWIQAAPDAATVGEWQLVQTSTVIGAAVQVTGPAVQYVVFRAPVDGNHGDKIDLHVQFRRVSGAGNVRGMVVGAWGVQT